MPLLIHSGAPTVLIRRSAYERAALVRAAIDDRLGLTDEEFRVEGDIVAIGPVHDADAFGAFMQDLEDLGLEIYEDYFELSGNWPAWVSLLAGAVGPGRSKPSQPHS